MRATSGAPSSIELVGQPMMDHRDHTRIAQQHLVDAVRGRVAVVGGLHVGVEADA